MEPGAAAVAIAACMAVVAGVLCWAPGAERRWMPWIRALLAAASLSATGSLVRLGVALFQCDFRFEYVYSHVTRSTPAAYRISALWAGQEGSLLLWGWVALAVAVPVAWPLRAPVTSPGCAARLRAGGVLAAIAGLWLGAAALGASPFTLLADPQPDGIPPSPSLLVPHMLVHPPLLYAGWALLAVPLAWALAEAWGAGAGKAASGPAGVDPWGLPLAFARWGWAILGASILVGAHWAYTTLGWGGYWAWDPVENVSLVPWLLALALLHAARRRAPAAPLGEAHGNGEGSPGALPSPRGRRALAVLPYAAIALGTYVTRIGALSSVHAFTGRELAWILGVPVAATLLSALAAVVPRGAEAPSRHPAGWPVDATVLLALVASAVVGAGTFLPVFVRITLGPAFYGRSLAPVAAAAVVSGAATWRGVLGLARHGIGARRRAALAVAHVGALVLLAGACGSAFDRDARLELGDGPQEALGYTVALVDLGETRTATELQVHAHLGVRPASGGPSSRVVRTTRVFPLGAAGPYTVPGTWHRWEGDVVLHLAGWTAAGERVFVDVATRPLIWLVWAGGGMVVIGSMLLGKGW